MFSQSGLPWLSPSAETPDDWIPMLRAHLPFPRLSELIKSLCRVTLAIEKLSEEHYDFLKKLPTSGPALQPGLPASTDPSSPDASLQPEPTTEASASDPKGKGPEDAEDATENPDAPSPLTLARQVVALNKGRAILEDRGLELCEPMVCPRSFSFFLLMAPFFSAPLASRRTSSAPGLSQLPRSNVAPTALAKKSSAPSSRLVLLLVRNTLRPHLIPWISSFPRSKKFRLQLSKV
jgi:hypothetical protein